MTKPTRSDVNLPRLQDLPAAESAISWDFMPSGFQRLSDPRPAARAAVEQPLDFPPLSEVVVPGDSVTIAVDPNVPDLQDVVAGIVDALPLGDLGDVIVLLNEEALESTLEALREVLPEAVVVKQHDAATQDAMAYLAANQAGDPLYLNRDLTFADLVIPVVLTRPHGSLDPDWVYGGIAPALADATSRRRYRYDLLMRRQQEQVEPRQVAWLLGYQLMVAVTPTVEGQIYKIEAGTADGIYDKLKPDTESNRQPATDDAVDLVLAYVDGDQQQQTWENIGRALHVARSLVQPGGTIALITAVDDPPRGSLLRLRELQSGNEDEIRKRLLKDNDRYALVATLLLDAMRDGRVVLYSPLEAERVEQLGLGALDTPQALDRLVSEHTRPGLLHCAQFCSPSQAD
ncbi:nickel-dependent lactate racemase family protein [Roseimaritima ulvae]|uniref:Uncharacterized protein n=1 Tax=Roseimaritima ulvae TaxID=980254 RepID=A0A5B9QRE0_9BACT|nr:lactate racemase domain-containing protein [Roseimaritima ulvae]QEG41667.1 hypothetical protein UC8_36930 [Roseimaritima ulvae]